MKKAISLLLAALLVMSVVPVSAINESVDSTGSVIGDLGATDENIVGRDSNQDKVSQYAEYSNAGNQNVEVYVTKASTYTITIPKVVILNGASNTATGEYTVKVEGDISGTESISVVPDASFELAQSGKNPIAATISQPKTKWTYADLATNATGTIEADGLTAGSWHGSFCFNISRSAAATLSGDGQTFHKMAPSALSFRSTAPMDEFKEVRVNGEVVDPSNYTLTEGSTIVTLNIDYLETLDVDKHEITVVSKNDAPSAGFEVIEPDLNDYAFYYNQPYAAYVDVYQDTAVFFFREDNTLDVFFINSYYIETATFVCHENNVVVSASTGTFNFTITANGKEIICEELQTTFKIGNELVMADEDYIYKYDSYLSGYKVMCINKNQANYGAIKTNIAGKPTKTLVEGMFAHNENLISIPEMPSIRDYPLDTFALCYKLEVVKIPYGIVEIGDDAFEQCKNLRSVTIPSSVTFIHDFAFGLCSNLTNIKFDGTVAQWNSIDKGPGTYPWNAGCPATEVICSDGVVPLV